MPRYVALLRGVSPMNCSMPELQECLASAGFASVRTVLSSGNVAFSTGAVDPAALELDVEEAMLAGMGYTFPTIVRTAESLRSLVANNPFAHADLSATAKPVITFLRTAPARALALPLERDGTRVLASTGTEVFTAYEPGPKAGAFMTLLERTFGRDITTRTLATVERCARALSLTAHSSQLTAHSSQLPSACHDAHQSAVLATDTCNCKLRDTETPDHPDDTDTAGGDVMDERQHAPAAPVSF